MFRNIFLTITALCFTVSVWAADFTVQKLPNGQTIVVQENHSNPIVTIDTWVRTGSVNETEANSGVAHFLEHLFFKGTKKHPVGEFDRVLESKGAIINAATSKDFTHYYITIPSEYFDKALELHADMLTDPQIPRKELEKERKVVLEEISKDLNTPAKKVYNNLNDLMYTHHPYKRKVIGSTDVISTIRREEILEFFNNFYIPSNMITVVVGDVDTSKVVEKVSQAFNSEYKKPIKKHFRKEFPIFTQKRKVEYVDTQSGYMMIGFRGVNICDNETFALDVLAEILGGGKSSKFYRNIKEQKGFAYSISASNGSYRDDGIFYISANYLPVNAEKVEKAIFDEITYIQKYGVTDEELNTAKKMIEQETYYSRESTSNISSELGYILTLTGSADLYNNYVENIKKVSANDVQRAAQKFLGVNKSAISIALPKTLDKPKQKVEKNHSAQKISESNGTSKYIIDNKSTLLLNKHTNNDIIAMSIIAKGGEFLESVIGEGTLVAGTILKGTQKYSSQELAQIMEQNGIKIEPSCSEDYFIVNVQTTTAQIDLTLEILDEVLNNALFDDYEIEKKRSEILNKIRQQRDVPMNIALEEFKTKIFENGVYSNTNKILERTLPSVTRENVLNYYDKVLDSKNVVVSVNGNVDSDKIISAFGAILTNKNQPEFKYSNHTVTKLSAPQITTKNIKDLQTSWLFLGWQTAGVKDVKDFVTLKIINTILGNGMSSRLYKNLREQDGLAYQLGSSYTPKALGGIFVTYIGTNPETLDYSKNKINAEIERLKMEFVSDSELQDAKDRLKGSFLIALETNSEKASTVGLFESINLGYDFYEKYIKMIDDVSASDIIRVSNKYFNNIYVESVVK
ncbi:MAG: insulinase family protein [Cyanobacteria bacterium SIG31]|nr:insulinase family protein [Cyanobacteria bacterium SIG31]